MNADIASAPGCVDIGSVFRDEDTLPLSTIAADMTLLVNSCCNNNGNNSGNNNQNNVQNNGQNSGNNGGNCNIIDGGGSNSCNSGSGSNNNNKNDDQIINYNDSLDSKLFGITNNNN